MRISTVSNVTADAPLNEWFAREYRRWWVQWRWAAYAAVGVLGLGVLLSLVALPLLNYYLAAQQSSGNISYQLYKIASNPVWTVVSYATYALPLLGALLIASQQPTLLVPVNVAAALDPRQLYNVMRLRLRRSAWLWLGLLVLLLPVVGLLGLNCSSCCLTERAW
jgi:hypothetical protein